MSPEGTTSGVAIDAGSSTCETFLEAPKTPFHMGFEPMTAIIVKTA